MYYLIVCHSGWIILLFTPSLLQRVCRIVLLFSRSHTYKFTFIIYQTILHITHLYNFNYILINNNIIFIFISGKSLRISLLVLGKHTHHVYNMITGPKSCTCDCITAIFIFYFFNPRLLRIFTSKYDVVDIGYA